MTHRNAHQRLAEGEVIVSQHTQVPSEADVIVCGGGPTGLSMAYLLGRAGLRVAMFERRATTTALPKGQYVHASAAEFFRQWGVWDLLEHAGWETEKSNGQGFYVNVVNGPVVAAPAIKGSHQDYERKWEPLSPVYPRKIPAADYEAAIRRQASRWPHVGLHFNSRVVEVDQQADGVRVSVQDSESLARSDMSAKYLVACDGSHSFVRSQVGRGQDHGPTFGNQILVEFRAALEDTLGRDGFFHSFILHPLYAGWFGSQHPENGLWRYSFRHDEEELPGADLVLERIRGALGMPELPVDIIQFYRFDYTTGILRNWREGRIFFAGDSAHWHSPWGGYGMNSGIQDANNLAWKLALAVKGLAGDGLLDSYEVERRSKALITVKSATYNSLHYQAIAEAVRLGEGALMVQGKISPEGKTFLEQRVAPHIDNSVLHTGYQFGTVYRSKAIRPSGEIVPTPQLCEYQETTVPGVRAPHAWLLKPDDQKVSTIDLWDGQFTLIGAELAAKWEQACLSVQQEFELEVRCVSVTGQGELRAADEKFAALYARVPGEAVLVRPDGFIAAKLRASSDEDAHKELAYSLRLILGRESDRLAQVLESVSA